MMAKECSLFHKYILGHLALCLLGDIFRVIDLRRGAFHEV